MALILMDRISIWFAAKGLHFDESSHIAESIVRVRYSLSFEDGHLDAIESNLEDWFQDVNRQRG